ncbi:unnamed protein product [Parnassius mnemosyne]|uniref:Uncharacterized protein n=1 Tax=Parnassius mnemosyne TaxID=213953 RepID=A0AAV1KB70_9NEOP
MLEASKSGISFALIQEPYVGGIGCMKDYRGVRVFQCSKRREGVVKAAKAVFDSNIDITQCPSLTRNNIAVVKIRTDTWELAVISLYLEPDSPNEPYLAQLKTIVSRMGRTQILIRRGRKCEESMMGKRERR